MENPGDSREAEVNENVSVRESQPLKEEPQKKKKLVYFEVDNENNARNVFEVPASFAFEELFRKSCNGNSLDAQDGLARGCSPNRNHVSSPKSCQLTAVSHDASRMMFDEFGIDLIELQNRILELERQLKNDNLGLLPIFSDLKSQVENFRNKLETAERCKEPEVQKESNCERFQYRRTSSERGRKIRDKFLSICEKEISKSTSDWLKQPSFDSSEYQDEEIMLFIQHMFVELGLTAKFNIRLPVLQNFLYEVYKNYNEVPFHNFRHCFCVAQMMYVIIWSVDIPAKMGDLDTLILLTSCVCHDLDHPGYNNIYQINARTKLALLYNDISPLENHHCSIAFRILENPECNIFASLDKETFKEIREGIIRCILATDMARHNEILTQFKEVISEFDFSNKGHKNLLSMILIKVADISNEARPMNVAEPWLDRLLTEFFQQSDAEKQEGLPVTPFMDRDKITKPSSQCSFIGFVLLPLFEALGELLPELHDLIIAPAKYALEHYRRLNEAAKDERMRRKSVAEAVNMEHNEEMENPGMVKSGSGHSVRSRRSFCSSCSQIRQRSKSSEDFDTVATPPLSPGAFSELLEDLENVDEQEEDVDEEMDEETVTEVEVSEKTLKFKISTEGSSTAISGRKSIPGSFSLLSGGSRKGSRERNQYSESEGDGPRDEEGRLIKRSVTSDTMSSRKDSSDSEKSSAGRSSRRRSGSSDRCEEARRRDHKQKGGFGKGRPEYRRKSLAVVENPRAWAHSHRRSSVSHGPETVGKEMAVIVSESGKGDGGTKRRKGREIEDSLLDKLESGLNENRYSRDFETSCWGLQNLKMSDTSLFNKSPAIVNNAVRSSLQKTMTTEKSKSEDNLAITAVKGVGDSLLGNNINVSKTEESIERQVAGSLEKKKKLGSNGHVSFLNKLRQLKERMTFGRDSEACSDVRPGPNPARKTGTKANNGGDQVPGRECDEDGERSRTLPKTKKPNRTSERMKKGWRLLIGKSEGNSCSSLEAPPSPGTTTPSPARLDRKRKSSVEEVKVAGDGERRKSPWMASPKKSSGFLGKLGRSEEEACGRHTFLNNLTSSFRKQRGGRNEEENDASSSSSMQEGSKPN